MKERKQELQTIVTKHNDLAQQLEIYNQERKSLKERPDFEKSRKLLKQMRSQKKSPRQDNKLSSVEKELKELVKKREDKLKRLEQIKQMIHKK